jgi:hypothetical protein
MPPKRPAPLQMPPRTASSNMRNQINLESQGILGRIKRHEDMDAAFAETDRHIAKVTRITCAVIRPIGREIICIAVKSISDRMNKVTPINTIFFYNRDDEMWLPMSSIFNRRPSNISGHVEERIHELTERAERERRSLVEFRAHPDVVSIRKYGVFGGMINAICSQLLKEHSDDIIKLAEDKGEVVVLTQDELDSFDVNELERTPDGFFADYNRQCVTFDVPFKLNYKPTRGGLNFSETSVPRHLEAQPKGWAYNRVSTVPVEHHRRLKKVPMKTRPVESMQSTIDDILSARFEGLHLPRESPKSKSSRIFSNSRKARPVMLRKLSKKAKKPASKKANSKSNNGAAKPDNTPKYRSH